MKSLLYIGNRLSVHGNNRTTIETLGPALEQQGFRVRYASSKKNKALRMLHMIVATLRYAPQSDYVLIDTYSTSNFWYAFIVSQLCRLLGAKYIPILHGGELPRRLAANPHLCLLIFANAYANVAPSRYLLDAFERARFDNIALIPNAIAINDYPFKRRDTISPKLLWVRAFASIYNPEMALNALAQVKTEFPDATLCMVGPDKEGSLEKMSKRAQELNLCVHFTGRLSRSEWVRLSQQYDIFINTTHQDNMPVSVIEAMALGLPVVSTNVGGLPFLVEDRQNGLLVADGDYKHMANCVINLVNDAQLAAKLAHNAHNTVLEFDQRTITAKWLEILK